MESGGGFYAKIKFGISAHFFVKNEMKAADLSVKMDSRVRGNDGVKPHILREKLSLEFPRIFLRKTK